ncbi:MAG: hypothetical protein ACK5U7_07400 [Bacteroidota bacterium]
MFSVLAAARSLHIFTATGENADAYFIMAAGALLMVYGVDRAADNRKSGRAVSEAWALLVPGLAIAPYGFWKSRHSLDDLAYQMAAAALLVVILYFVFIVRPQRSRFKFLRELTAAAVFAWVLVAIPNRDAAEMPMLAVLFAGTCMSNLLVFSRLDYEKDAQLGMQGLLHASWFRSDMRAMLRAAYVWTLFLPVLLAFYLLAPEGFTQAGTYRMGGLYLGIVMLHWILAEVHADTRGAMLFRLLADAVLLCWLAL